MAGLGLSLGRPFGIETRVHWTFGLLLAWAGWVEYQRIGWSGALFSMAILSCLFACVILHELGHCLAARRFSASAPVRSALYRNRRGGQVECHSAKAAS